MPEICLSGSEGGAKHALSLPLSQLRVSTTGIVSKRLDLPPLEGVIRLWVVGSQG